MRSNGIMWSNYDSGKFTNLPDTRNPTVELYVDHFVSFIAIGLFSGDSDLISPGNTSNNKYIA